MRDDKKKRLESKGWKIGSTKDFLDLSPDGLALLPVAEVRRQAASVTRAEVEIDPIVVHVLDRVERHDELVVHEHRSGRQPVS